ncbi:MAG TPA: TIGR00730 family Rossman fold protein [Candidatus Saccharimonadales bacterium]|nr:TIGR00730 family Rossman fold protein [Candidatus Saccharimonadales bacterium]
MRICVFCGANPGAHPVFAETAAQVGATLARQSVALVYGGGRTGLMGAVADAALREGGEVIGVIPQALEKKELAHLGLTRLHVVSSMHERKSLMAELSDGFIAMPGGIGTMEELFEIWTWGQLGLHTKPCGLLNVNGYFQALLSYLDEMVAQRFLRPEHREMLMAGDNVDDLLELFRGYHPPQTSKWIDRETT